MKQYLFLATAIATASLFTGCSNNEYVGDQPEAFNGTDGAIVFSMGKANTTRATLDASQSAQKLNYVFYVYGEKYYNGTPTTTQKVFDTYKVQYKPNNSDKSASNTTGWEYVFTNPWETNEKENVGGGVNNQTIKYWDYSADHYTFYAFSANPNDVKTTTPNIPNIKVSKIKDTSTDPCYTVTILDEDADIGALYFADKKEVTKAGGNGGYAGPDDTPADKAVKLQFRNLASKVRVGFYETVPGYSIKIDKMYEAEDDGSGFKSSGNTSAFVAMCPNYKAQQNSQITVKYGTSTVGTLNQAYVDGKKKEDGGAPLEEAKTLTLGDGVFTPPLATTSFQPTWDNGGDYTFFWPQPENTDPLKIKVDYTLTAENKDAANPVDKPETIKVTGATATVPKEYVAWKGNTAYTYIFKISVNTNGTTGDIGDKAGLYPITFDAVVEDMAEKTYLTTVSTLSVTASQDGTNFETPGAGFVFKLGKQITLKVMQDNTDVTEDATITGDYITGYDYNKTPEQNLKKESKNFDQEQSNTLDGRSAAGYWVLKVEYSSSTTYVIICVDNAEKEPSNP